MPTRTRLVTASFLLISLAGCSDLFPHSTSTVKFFASHAGTPTDGIFPNYGDAGSTRVFVTDTGWEIALAESYVTTADVRLVRCGREQGTTIEMFWGTCPEDFIEFEDRQTLALGAVTIDDGSYCGVDVVYGPYVFDEGEEEHTVPENEEVFGKTVYLAGIARRDEGGGMPEEVPFLITSDEVMVVRIDISELDDGSPVYLDHENFTRDLTIVKPYDQFFSGIDFSTATPEQVHSAVIDNLQSVTYMVDGSTVTG